MDISTEEPFPLEAAASPEDDIVEEVVASLVREAVAEEELSTEIAVSMTQETVHSEGRWLRSAYDDLLSHLAD